MKIKSVDIGGIKTENNVFLAPLAGYSDAAMREICYKAGAGLCFSEMVSAKGLIYNSQGTKDLLFTYDDEPLKAVQLFGSDPEIIKRAANSEYLEKFDIIDINCGCPVQKVYGNGEGSALLKDLNLAGEIVKAAKSAGKPVTVKMRIGINEGEYVTSEFAKAAENSGADMITVHGRVKTAVYSGEPIYKEIAAAKSAVKIPVIANGGIFCAADADKMINETGADGVMLARGAMQNPLLFCEILGKTPPFSFKEAVLEHLGLICARYGEERAAVIFRKQSAFYLKGIYGSKKLKERAFSAKNADELKVVLSALRE